MLQNIHVKNMALIDEADVDFGGHLNILTGETGAGKSIIIGSISTALGGKVSRDVIRKDAEYALVELNFKVNSPQILAELEKMEIPVDGDEVVISRRITGSRSVARINGELVSLPVLRQAAALLIDIHGQHEHQSLLYKKNHLQILDEFAKEELGTIKKQYGTCYQLFKEKQKELEKASIDEETRRKEADFLTYEINEIEAAHIKEGEDELLEEQYQKMCRSQKVMEHLQEAYQCCFGQDASAGELLSRSAKTLQSLVGFEKRADDLYDQIAEIDSLLSDLGREIAEYMSSWEFSEEEFAETEERLNVLNHIKNRYGKTLEDVNRALEEKKARLDILSDYDLYLERLKKELRDAEETLQQAAERLTTLRKKAAKELTAKISSHLLDLNFLEVKFEMVFQKFSEFTLSGIDDVEFMISMNPGLPVRPLAEIASGGELSRIMLAIKTVMADKDEIETLIFDEIDVGISGRTAQKVSEKMAYIGKKHQVICITHLAQIAAMADAHFLIEKTVEDQTTTTDIQLLNEEQSVEELARILGGAEITAAVLENAREMKELANRTK